MKFVFFSRPVFPAALPAGLAIFFLVMLAAARCPSLLAANATSAATNSTPNPTGPSQLIVPHVLPPKSNTLEAERFRMAELNARERRAQLLPKADTNFIASTNLLPIKGYEIVGNTVLSPGIVDLLFQPYIGTNMNSEMLRRALKEFQTVYRDRGYVTVSVRLPPQKLTNGILKVVVFEGRLANVIVTGNHYFSSNNVMHALPGLRTNMILVGPIFETELNRANINQDRQILPEIAPGPEEGTTDLHLKVHDQLPLHAKLELNNENSPGTPDLRVNGSAVYNNLWQWEHSVGVQYSFSPEEYKQDPMWEFYDLPLVANYSGFYRLPLCDYQPVEKIVEASPGTFGYSEATRRFSLPPPSGAELNVYASRSTVDTGIETVFSAQVYNTNGNSLDRTDYQQDITVNQDIGFRLTLPLPSPSEDFQSSLSGGFDYKTYDVTSYKTNVFNLSSEVIDTTGGGVPVTNINNSVITSPVPTTDRPLQYIPLGLRYDASLRDSLGTTTIGFGLNVNLWNSGGMTAVQNITGSSQSSGHWVAFTENFSRDFIIHNDWDLVFRADAQLASEPVIPNEQFGAGGINSVRGYHEGEVFGDDGFHVSLEQKTPAHLIGMINGGTPLTVRASLYMDYATIYLLDPQSAPQSTSLWSTGVGVVAAAGTHWEARMWFSEPLLSAGTTTAYQPVFNFSLTAQF